VFSFEKKNQKTFALALSSRDVSLRQLGGTKETKVFWFFFSKKNTSSLGFVFVPRPKVLDAALRKLDMLDAAEALSDLRSPPGNRLEALAAALADLHSMRINDQFRLCFRWTNEGPEDVHIIDYH
jgi:proteic killer suppression protein